jgi:hypothetical protein
MYHLALRAIQDLSNEMTKSCWIADHNMIIKDRKLETTVIPRHQKL